MAFTKWSFSWSSPWGGSTGSQEPLPPPIDDTVPAPILGGLLWLADDEPGDASDPDREITAGDAIGWAPKVLGDFGEGGDLSMVAIRNPLTELTDVKLIRSDYDSAFTILTGFSARIRAIHSELFGVNAVTGVGDNVPSFVAFSIDLETGSIVADNFSLLNIEAVPNNSVVWDNDLDKAVEDLRFVSMETNGTVIVAMSESTAFPTQAFYLKSTFGSGAATPASEIVVDLRPDETYSVVPDRFHVVETHNRVLLFYYEVIDGNGASHVAFMAYTPVHATFAPDLPYNEGGLVRPPAVILPNARPILSQKGARRHPVSNFIVLGVEPEDTDSRGLQIHWYATQGYGYTSFGPPVVWDADNHPHLFGGRLGAAAENRVINIISVGWADARQGGDFPVIGSLQVNDIPDGASDFVNFYRTDVVAQRERKRACLGTLYVPRFPSDSNPGGLHAFRYAGFSTMEHNELERGGYHMPTDSLLAVAVLPMDEVSAGVTPATVGPNAAASGGLVVSSGMVNQSLYFYDQFARAEIPGTEDQLTPSVAVSCWVFPENSGDINANPDDFTIAFHTGLDDFAWRLHWREDLQEFRWLVTAFPDGTVTINSSSLGALPFKHWYHVTATYDDDTQKSQLYVNGFLVAENQFGPSAELAVSSVPNPIRIGYSGQQEPWRSFQGRLDDFVVGKRAGEQYVQAAYHHGLLSKAGIPMRGSRDSAWKYQDQVIATSTLPGSQGSGTIYTVALRRVSMSPLPLLRNQLVFDVWRIQQEADPEFMGLIVLPTEVYDRRSFVLTDTLGAPLAESSFDAFELTTVYGQDFNESTPSWQLIWMVRGDTEGGATNAAHIYRTNFDPELPTDAAATPSDIVTRILDPSVVTALGAAFRPNAANGNELVVFAAVTDFSGPAGSFLHLIRGPDFAPSGITTANKRQLINFLPEVSTDGSFFSYDYEEDFGDNHPPLIRGIVARATEPGSGFPDETHNGGMQLIFGLQSFPGNPTGKNLMTIGTLSAYLPHVSFDPPVGGDFPIEPNGLPRQLDEYGVGGVDPFIPLTWMQHPVGLTGDSFLLGRTGTRSYDNTIRDGNGGLRLYSVKRQGNWGVQDSVVPGPFWSANLSQSVGASAAIATRSDEDEDAVQVYVSRPHPDSVDKFSTVYVSPEEAASGGWTPVATSGVIPLLRRNDRASVIATLGYRLNSRNLTEEKVGGEIKIGSRYRYAVTLRWSYPGSTVDIAE